MLRPQYPLEPVAAQPPQERQERRRHQRIQQILQPAAAVAAAPQAYQQQHPPLRYRNHMLELASGILRQLLTIDRTGCPLSPSTAVQVGQGAWRFWGC
jgi:hypothetical protein